MYNCKWIYGIVISISSYSLFAQNLVVNPSFEEYNAEVFSKTCMLLFQDSINVNGWRAAGNASSKSSHQCFTSSMYVSNKKFGIKPHEGKWMIGFKCMTFPIGNNQREYITGKLTEPLKAGYTYKMVFYISPRDGCEKGIKELGIAFSKNFNASSDYNNLFIEKPQLSVSITEVIEKGKWTKVETIYTARGNEQYFTIGNFNIDSNTMILTLGDDSKKADHWNWYAQTFYFIDNVSIIELPKERNATLIIKD
jgi:hypothetical protein